MVANGFLGRSQIAGAARGQRHRERASARAAAAELSLDHRGEERHVREATIDEVEARADAVTPDDVADILFTSGTTGRAKGAMSAHRQSIGVARAWAELGGVSADDRYLVVNPFFHSFGYKIGIIVGLLTGATLYPVATFDVTATMRSDPGRADHLFPGAPTLYQSILAAPDRGDFDLELAPARGDRRGRRTGRADRADAATSSRSTTSSPRSA